MVGGAWISRDHQGNVLFHTRNAFTPSSNRLTPELRCIMWAMQSVYDLGIRDLIIDIDLHAAFLAVSDAQSWPRYRHLINKINVLCSGFNSSLFDQESVSSNSIARDISRSVYSRLEAQLLSRPWRSGLASQQTSEWSPFQHMLSLSLKIIVLVFVRVFWPLIWAHLLYPLNYCSFS